MSGEETARPCRAITKSGRPCHLVAQPGSDYCPLHSAGDIPRPAAQGTERIGSAPATEAGGQAGTASGGMVEAAEEARHGLRGRLKTALKGDWFERETWQGAWYLLSYTAKMQADMLKRRYTGEYQTDEWGFDQEFLDTLRPVLTLLYTAYWRVQASGLDQIPVEGPALLVVNCSGPVETAQSALFWEALMVSTAVLTQHPAQRLVRTLHGEQRPSQPFVSGLAVKLGQTLATPDNGRRLLAQGEVVAVYPEVQVGPGPVPQRGTSQRTAPLGPFDPTFAAMVQGSGAPIIPVAVVGVQEAALLPARSRLRSLSARSNIPWMPLPTTWTIDFGRPIAVPDLPGEPPPALIAQVADQVRNVLQAMLQTRLAERRSAFWG